MKLYELQNFGGKKMKEPSRIKQLDEKTIGHIAAGEVVRRHQQVVKNLLKIRSMLMVHYNHYRNRQRWF